MSEHLAKLIKEDGPLKVLIYRSSDDTRTYVAHSLLYNQLAAAPEPNVALDRLLDQVMVFLADCSRNELSQEQRATLPPQEVAEAFERGIPFRPKKEVAERLSIAASIVHSKLPLLEVKQVFDQQNDKPLKEFASTAA